MRAATHTEVYRAFTGRLKRMPLRPLAVATTCVRTATKSRLALVLIYLPPAIATVVFSMIVYGKYALQSGLMPTSEGFGTGPGEPLPPLAMMFGSTASSMIEVRAQLYAFHWFMRGFAVIAVAWYATGLVCEDRRHGAHLLWFARPLTRFDYAFGKLLAAAFFGALAALFPVVVISGVAAFASPDWSFVREETELIAGALGYSVFWVFVVGSISLAVSSLAERKSFALVGFLGLFVATEAIGGVLTGIFEDPAWMRVGLWANLSRVGAAMLRADIGHSSWPATDSVWILLAWAAASLFVLDRAVRRMEVAA